MPSSKGRNSHEWFRELCALSVSGDLTGLESAELQAHLEVCEPCHELVAEYRMLATDGMAVLAEFYREERDSNWDEERASQKLLERVRASEQASPKNALVPITPTPSNTVSRSRRIATRLVPLALAAGLILAVAAGVGYHLGVKHPETVSVPPGAISSGDGLEKLTSDKTAADALSASQASQLAVLQRQNDEKEREIQQLQQGLRAAEERADALGAASGKNDEKLNAALRERDSLNAQLQASTESYEKDRADLVKLRSERDGTLIRTNSLESRINELTAVNRDQDRRLKETEQYLSSDRDIRELMGARKLYIADVFDVDGSSQTQRPFGRVFYTQGKSLIFYAFDLDRQPKVINASTFQVWGQRETAQGEQAIPMNLGILYMDSEANRRWVMRFDDPKQLAEIDAVFVTVEPHGGSRKPTTKPFLYALLRNQANHP